jgi:hypothetical protein
MGANMILNKPSANSKYYLIGLISPSTKNNRSVMTNLFQMLSDLRTGRAQNNPQKTLLAEFDPLDQLVEALEKP